MIRIGTVGTGFVVDTFVDAVKKTGEMQITAVYSRSTENANAFAKKHTVAKSYTDKNAFLADPDLDFIYVASPNSLHSEWTMAALNAGKNVFCEKPFMSTVREVEEAVALAKEKKLFLFEAVTVPHLPNYKLLREHIKDISPIKLVQLNFSQFSSRYNAFMDGKLPNVFNPEFSGGALMDINYYNLNFIVGLFGVPEDIKYYPNQAANGIDTSGILIMRYADFVCTAVGCKDSKSKNMVQIQGTSGYIYVPEESSRCIEFSVVTKDGEKKYNEQTVENSIYYELVDFCEIYNKKDFARRDEMLDYNLTITGLVEKARKEAGVLFAADEK
ncbi:MAG: Gfo/Idh/MocA family oxidoreductase [Oscillospiraceae bacterium]